MDTLEAFFEDYEEPIQTFDEKIRQRRCQMIVHSYIYYVMDSTLVSDHQWQAWANELTELQKQKKNIGFYDKVFKDWDGSTGMHLHSEIKDDWVRQKAIYLMTINDKYDMSAGDTYI